MTHTHTEGERDRDRDRHTHKTQSVPRFKVYILFSNQLINKIEETQITTFGGATLKIYLENRDTIKH